MNNLDIEYSASYIPCILSMKMFDFLLLIWNVYNYPCKVGVSCHFAVLYALHLWLIAVYSCILPVNTVALAPSVMVAGTYSNFSSSAMDIVQPDCAVSLTKVWFDHSSATWGQNKKQFSGNLVPFCQAIIMIHHLLCGIGFSFEAKDQSKYIEGKQFKFRFCHFSSRYQRCDVFTI